MASKEYELAKWFVEEIQGRGWYFPDNIKDLAVAKQLINEGVDPEGEPIPAWTVEQIKVVATALKCGCHLTDWVPVCENRETSWLCERGVMKGLWVVKRFVNQFYNEPPDMPPHWEQQYDDWVRIFGLSALRQGKFLIYAGWSQKGPYESGIHPDELEQLFSKEFVELSIGQWEKVYG